LFIYGLTLFVPGAAQARISDQAAELAYNENKPSHRGRFPRVLQTKNTNTHFIIKSTEILSK
jgi:hypothetical protein